MTWQEMSGGTFLGGAGAGLDHTDILTFGGFVQALNVHNKLAYVDKKLITYSKVSCNISVTVTEIWGKLLQAIEMNIFS